MSAGPESPTPAFSPLIADLHQLLLSLHGNPWPELPNPPKCKKRASVACLIRIRPRYPDIHTPPHNTHSSGNLSSSEDPFVSRLNHFFSLEWVQRGTPEVLFIKRAARRGDRWTSHVALPGGKRDPNDASDVAAAVRETLEEVGINLSSASSPASLSRESQLNNSESLHAVHPDPHGHGPEPHISTEESAKEDSQPWPPAFLAGALPQRLITTDFGMIPLMTASLLARLMATLSIPGATCYYGVLHMGLSPTSWV